MCTCNHNARSKKSADISKWGKPHYLKWGDPESVRNPVLKKRRRKMREMEKEGRKERREGGREKERKEKR